VEDLSNQKRVSFTAGTPMATKRVYTVEEVQRLNLKDHVLVFGFVSISGLHSFITTLRSDKPTKHIVFMCDTHPPERHLGYLRYDNIYFVYGNTMNRIDLRGVGVDKASNILIISGKVNSSLRSTAEWRMLDSWAITTMYEVQAINPKANMIVDLIHEENIKFFIGTSNSYDFTYAPAFATGKVYVTSFLQRSLIIQAYYNQRIIALLRILVSKNSFDFPESIAEQQSNLCVMKLPEKFHRKTFGELFEHLADEGKIAVGLRRPAYSVPFVLTLPPTQTPLHESDLVYVL